MTSRSHLGRRTAVIACGGASLVVMPLVGLESAFAGAAALWTIDTAMLFGVLWTLAAIALFMGIRLLPALYAGGSLRRPALLLQVAVLVLAAVGWLGIVGDQMPCFLGKPSCD